MLVLAPGDYLTLDETCYLLFWVLPAGEDEEEVSPSTSQKFAHLFTRKNLPSKWSLSTERWI